MSICLLWIPADRKSQNRGSSPRTSLTLSDYQESLQNTAQLLSWPAALSEFRFRNHNSNTFAVNFSMFHDWLLPHKDSCEAFTSSPRPAAVAATFSAHVTSQPWSACLCHAGKCRRGSFAPRRTQRPSWVPSCGNSRGFSRPVGITSSGTRSARGKKSG